MEHRSITVYPSVRAAHALLLRLPGDDLLTPGLLPRYYLLVRPYGAVTADMDSLGSQPVWD